jgi:hypothetical protein
MKAPGGFASIGLICALMILWNVPGEKRFAPRDVQPSAAGPMSTLGLSAPVFGPKSVILEGEDLLYEVSWWAIKIGQIRIKVMESKVSGDTISYTAAAFIDSYNLPFVDLHSVTSTRMDSTLYCSFAKAVERRGEKWWVLKHYPEPHKKRIIIENVWQREMDGQPLGVSQFDTLVLGGLVQDGLSILYFARANAHSHKMIRVPTIVYRTLGSTLLTFENRKTNVEIEALDAPVSVTHFDGKAEFEGIFGLTGNFEGWVSDDEASVPIKAKLGVILGSVNIELKEWKRPGWKPPLETQ